MTSKQFNKLTDILTDVLGNMLQDEDDITQVLTAWKERRSDVQKVFGKSAKAPKDSNAPKKPRSAYILYCMDARPKLVAKETNLEPPQVMKRLGEMWRELSEKKKKKYKKLHEEDKERYNSEMENYTPPSQEELEEANKKKKKKARSGPSRPRSSYLFFSSAIRPVVKEEMPELSGKEIMSEIGRRWKALSDKDKKPYTKLYDEDKIRYERECEQVKANEANDDDGNDEEETTTSSKKKTKSKKSKTKSKSKKSTTVEKTPGYAVFVDEQSEELQEAHPKWKSKKLTSELNKAWLALSDEERNAYEEEANQSAQEDEESDVFDDSSDDALEEGV